MKPGVSVALFGVMTMAWALGAAEVAAQGYSYPTPLPQNPPPAPPSEPPPPKVSEHRGLQGGVTIGVPIWLDIDRDIVRPGADLQFFGGYDIGYAMFGLNLGVSWNPINLNRVPNLPPNLDPGRDPLTRLYFAPEVRVQVPNPTPLLPYLAATFDVNWWRFRETTVACNVWYCTSVAVFRFTPGFTAKAGIALRLRGGKHIDLGLKYSLTGPGDFFNRREQWITPYVGFLIR
ncbi:MAG: hypothetical protein AAF997_00570 [Myxococcota bacterium]